MSSLEPDQLRALGELVAVYPVAAELAERVDAAGHELHLVGGTVRDTLLKGSTQQDLDFATSASPEQTERLLRGWADSVWLTGARFGTVSAHKGGWRLEITTYRADTYAPGSRHPDVEFGDDVVADLSRRDFTVNAMAVRLPDGIFVDPFGGLSDLHARVLRTPVEPERSFADDPLRLVRMCRFAARLAAQPAPEVLRAATAMAAEITTISAERVRDELTKLVTAEHPKVGLNLLCDTGLADHVLPELPALRMERDPHHHHKDVYAHTLAVVDDVPADDATLRLAALLHDVGKPATRRFHADGKVSFHHHEVVGARMAEARLRALRYPNQMIEDVTDLVALHLRFHGYSEEGWTDSAVRRYVRDAGRPEQLERLNQLTKADVTTRNRRRAKALRDAVDALAARIDELAEAEEIASLRPPLDGNEIMEHLGLRPGPLVGEARAMLLEHRIEHGPVDKAEALELLEKWAAERGVGG